MLTSLSSAGVGLFCKSGKNTFGNVGRVVGGAQDNEDCGDCNDCLEDDVDEASYQLARGHLAVRREINMLGGGGMVMG